VCQNKAHPLFLKYHFFLKLPYERVEYVESENPDEVYYGKKLFRTYIGPRYFGGFSDHLPVYIDLAR